jgi:hypothetical protein
MQLAPLQRGGRRASLAVVAAGRGVQIFDVAFSTQPEVIPGVPETRCMLNLRATIKAGAVQQLHATDPTSTAVECSPP